MRGARSLMLSLLAAAATAGISATPAAAAQISSGGSALSYIDFVGVCTDCTGYGRGVLTLQGYTVGTALTASEFVDFTYSSNLVPSLDLEALNLQSIAGTFTALPGKSDITFSAGEAGTEAVWTLTTSTTGAWDLSFVIDEGNNSEFPTGTKGGANLDRGSNFRFTLGSNGDLPPGAVPEPQVWGMMIAGFALAGAVLRRRRPQAGAAL